METIVGGGLDELMRRKLSSAQSLILACADSDGSCCASSAREYFADLSAAASSNWMASTGPECTRFIDLDRRQFAPSRRDKRRRRVGCHPRLTTLEVRRYVLETFDTSILDEGAAALDSKCRNYVRRVILGRGGEISSSRSAKGDCL